MEKISEKVPVVSSPSYKGDSDAESIIKPEISAFEDTTSKPVPAWTWRSKRLRLAFVGVVSIIVILAIVLGVLASKNILIKKPAGNRVNLTDNIDLPGIPKDCTKIVYRTVPGSPHNETVALWDAGNIYCAATANGILAWGRPSPKENAGQCAGWVTESTPAEVKQAYVDNKQLMWSCFDWSPSPQQTSGNTGPIFVAGGVILNAGGYLGGVALIITLLMAITL